MNRDFHLIEVKFLRGGSVGEFARLFHDIENAYNSILAFTDLVETSARKWYDNDPYFERRKRGYYPLWEPVVDLSADNILPSKRIHLEQININSPGDGLFSGLGEPLEQVRLYLNDRNERRKDKEWREPNEVQKAYLEKDLLEEQLMAKRLEI